MQINRIGLLVTLACGIGFGQALTLPQELLAALQTMPDATAHGCVALFDKNDPTGHLLLKMARNLTPTPKLDAFAAHGLVVRQDVRVSLAEPSRIPGMTFLSKVKAWRYDWSGAVSGDVVDDELCYGYNPVVTRVLRWTEPQDSRTSVQYAWHYEKIADWAKQATWLGEVDPEAGKAIDGKEQIGQRELTRFNDGWH